MSTSIHHEMRGYSLDVSVDRRSMKTRGDPQKVFFQIAKALLAITLATLLGGPANGQDDASAAPVLDAAAIGERLIAGYTEFVATRDGNEIVFNDGTRLPLDDGSARKNFSDWLNAPDIKDMFRFSYPAGAAIAPPDAGSDPGRARHEAFFAKIYGDCTKGGVRQHLVDVAWLPQSSGGKVSVTALNGVADRVRKISAELDALPASFKKFLIPAGGGYVCRKIAGTETRSPHGYGIAIDINAARGDYWRWQGRGKAGNAAPPFKNAIPAEIVAIFEAHGFIWGGRWHHFDTMHFEYRPELFDQRP